MKRKYTPAQHAGMIIVLVLLGVIAGLGITGMTLVQEFDINRGTTQVYETNRFQDSMQYLLADIHNHAKKESYLQSTYSSDHSNLHYELYRKDESGMIQAISYNQAFGDAAYQTYYKMDADCNMIRTDSLSDAKSADEFIFVEVSQSLQAMDLIKVQNVVFDTVYRWRFWYTPTVAVALIGVLVLLVLLGRGKTAANWFDRLPFGVSILLLVLMFYALTCLAPAEVPLNYAIKDLGIYSPDMNHVYSSLLYIAACFGAGSFAAAAVVQTVVIRKKNGTLVLNTLLNRLAGWTERHTVDIPSPVLIDVTAVVLLLSQIYVYVRYMHHGMLSLIYLIFVIIVTAAAIRSAAGFQVTLNTGRAMAEGNYEEQITDHERAILFHDLKKHEEDLEHINSGLKNSLNQKMKSERLRTELITNVSHDLKTPLAGIISYVDLLKQEHSPEQETEYIEALDRQSRRLKRLTEDVIEASRAASGAIEVHPENINLRELLVQAEGEYQQKLKQAHLESVIQMEDPSIAVYADGRLTWRILSNLLSNACKYSLAGTRVYINAAVNGKACTIHISSTSSTPLGISADELMERFVRGDASRHTEGSGLGLSIAKSLAELQGGAFNIRIEGDQFTAEVVLPTANGPEIS
ncbi:MAG: HAMP domain-containing histidine kinase [Solobacterium sp.]|jgi:signal transduction histidine kinase|nr:HAMP domain-containing histidine kinase [Solobacterium sp.]MCH4221846.1 HAMP domain-containing histidine kinase [Solobacterium sp.]MCH4265169.1 HAMP domain-containing histidine kinase [Solobacterium sp.]